MFRVLLKALSLFDARERWSLLGLFGATVIMGLAQMVGVASILPFLTVVADPDVVHSNERLNAVYTALNFSSETSFLIAMGVVVLGIIAFSNATVAFTTWLILRFTWEKNRSLSVRLLQKYLDEPYAFYLGRNTSKLGKNILAEVTAVVSGVLVPALKLLAKCVLVTLILVLLIMTDPLLATISAGVLGGMYGAIYMTVRRKQLRLGRERVKSGSARFKSATEALTGIKDVKVLGCEPEFLRRFSAASARYTSTQASNAMISELPKFALDTVAFGGVLLIVLYVLSTRGEVTQVLPVIGLYVFAAYRLMPALQTIFNSLAKIRFNSPALDVLHGDLMSGDVPTRERVTPSALVPFEHGIELRGVWFRYPTSDDWVLRDVTMELPKNSMVGFVGTTGSGKTTLVDILLGLLEPQQGCIAVDGLAIGEEHLAAWRGRIGYVPQHIFLTDSSVTKNIAFGVPDGDIDHAAVERAARIANIHDFIGELSEGYDTIVGDRGLRLSGGQRQRIGIARALYRDPDVLVLDEATSALDGVTEDGVMQAIHNLARRKTIVLIAHRLTTLRECDAIFMFNDGQLVDQGAFQQLAARNSQFQEMARLTSDSTPSQNDKAPRVNPAAFTNSKDEPDKSRPITC